MLPPCISPAVSVIVPVHDVAAHVGAAIASLRAQDMADFEAIVIDDGSTDGSGQLAEAAIGGDPRFRLIRQDNRGLSQARNAGLALARGAFIAFLDGDDRLAPQFLSRMLAAIKADGGPWVACAVADCWPDGRQSLHPAIHGVPMPEAARRWPLDDWQAVIAHYPSAWNKLYRRDLIGDARFAEGLWFEDHGFYLELAGRAGHLLHLPDPLYLQTRGRPGQITATDSERVFDQFAVLDDLQRQLSAPGGLPGGQAAFARLSARLLAERAPVLRDAGRRARWLAAARDYLDRHGLVFEAAQSPSLAHVLGGGLPVSVVLAVTDGVAPASLEALAEQDIAGLDIVLAGPGAAAAVQAVQAACPGRTVQAVPAPSDPWAAWAAGAMQAQGAGIALWRDGDGAEPIALRHWADALLGQAADLVVSAFRVPRDGGYRTGWADPAGLAGPLVPGQALPPARPGAQPFCPLLSAKLLAPAAARRMLAGAPALAAAAPLGEEAAMQHLARHIRRPVWVDFPGAQPGPRPLPAPRAVLAALDSPALAGAEPRRTALRALRMDLDLRPPGGRLRLALWLLAARIGLHRAGLARATGALDPAISARMRRLLGLGD
ncbi:glycosyltransferase family 2 protein [Gemmobacter sp.]|uniref:glycosyltransferase family 2 protein n=1 Tax=Gemmobacter sp. TaxID=1898957 RepID=UPI002AFFB9EE|nr:glycosyltransferase family 2 protein [Gemmobacter sp.]